MAKTKTGKQKVFEELARMKDLKVSDLGVGLDEIRKQTKKIIDTLKREEKKDAT